MKTFAFCCVLSLAVPAAAQVNVQIQLPLPRIVFNAPPPLVVIEPGVQVVEDHDDEVFFVDSWYWHRSGPSWYRTRTHDGAWVIVEERQVPVKIVRLKPGHYRRWRGPGHGGAVIVNPPGPGKVKVKGGKHKKHDDDD